MIVKSFKSFVCKICLEENGHVVMMGLFDCVDDTVLVKKALLSVSMGVWSYSLTVTLQVNVYNQV